MPQILRSLARTPGLCAALVLTLALALGSIVAVFTLVDGVLLKPLPYPHAGRLVQIDHAAPGIAMERLGVSIPLVELYAENSRSLEAVAAYRDLRVTLAGAGAPSRLEAAELQASIFEVLGVQPVLGRPFEARESLPGVAPVVVLGHSLWQRRFAGSSDVLGESLLIDGVAHEIVGVLARGTAFPKPDTELWLPRPAAEEDRQLSFFNDYALGLLAEGESLESAQRDFERLTGQLAVHFPGEGENFQAIGLSPTLRSRLEHVVGSARQVLWVLLAAVALIVGIASANAANLFLVRLEERDREISLRQALGARRSQLIGRFLAESLTLSALAAVLGLGLAAAAVQAVVAVGGAEGLQIPRLENAAIGGRSALFGALIAVGSGALFGLVPAWKTTRSMRRLGSARGSTADRSRHRLRAALVVSQLALGLLLAVTCSLVVRSLHHLRAVDPGFDASGALTFRTMLPEVEYPDPAARAAVVSAALERLQAIPGTLHAGAASYLPLSGIGAGGMYVAEGHTPSSDEPGPASRHCFASAGYLEAMGIEVLAGRSFVPSDLDSEEPRVVISAAMARRLWGGESEAIGRRLSPAGAGLWHTVIGVVEEVSLFRLDEPPPEFVYLPLVGPEGAASTFGGGVSFVLRTAREPGSLTAEAREILTDLNPQLALSTVRPLEQLVREARGTYSFAGGMLSLASLMSLAIAAVGLYGTISFLVKRRRREIGIRMALGAQRSAVHGSILAEGLRLAAAGVVLGWVLAAASSRLLASLLFGVEALDPASFLVAPAVLLAVAALATSLPALRASRLEPTEALRSD
ncbi:MAG: ABC transporter permease [Acidobacteriota bacterium]